MSTEDAQSYLKRASFWVVIENIVKVLEPVLVMACLKVFGGGEWGAFKVFEAVALIGMRTTCLGLERGLIWYHSQCDEAEHRRAFWQTIFFMIALATVLVGGVWGLGALDYSPLPDPRRYGLPSLTIPLFALAMLLQALMYPATQFLVSRGVLHFNMLARFVALPIGIFGSALLLRGLGVQNMALPLAYVTGCALAAITAFCGVFYYVPGIWKSFNLRPIPPWHMLRFSVTISSSEIAMAMAARLDIYLLTTHFGLQAVEVYTTLVMVVNTLRTIRQSFDNIMLGLFSRMAKAAHSALDLAKAYWQANTRVMSLQLPVMVVLIAYGNQLLHWLLPHGDTWQSTLAIGLVLIFCATPFGLGMQWQIASGRSWFMPLGQVIFVSLNAGLNYALIPHYGVLGGLVASGMAQISGGIPATLLCWKESRYRLFGIGFWKPLAPSLLWPLWLAAHFLLRSPWLDLPLLALLSVYWLRLRKSP